MSEKDRKKDEPHMKGKINRDDKVDDTLREIFNPILDAPVPPKIDALLNSLVQKMKREE